MLQGLTRAWSARLKNVTAGKSLSQLSIARDQDPGAAGISQRVASFISHGAQMRYSQEGET